MTGATLGNRILGMTVVRRDLRAPGIAIGFNRTVVSWLSAGALGLGFLWAIWDRRSHTWHDKVTGTFVVRTNSLPDARHRARAYTDRSTTRSVRC
jgi:uncharacterized RDD family membrane protein YckC